MLHRFFKQFFNNVYPVQGPVATPGRVTEWEAQFMGIYGEDKS